MNFSLINLKCPAAFSTMLMFNKLNQNDHNNKRENLSKMNDKDNVLIVLITININLSDSSRSAGGRY